MEQNSFIWQARCAARCGASGKRRNAPDGRIWPTCVLEARLRHAFGAEKVQEEVSGFYIANEVRKNNFGMSIALEPSVWVPFQTMSPAMLANELVRFAACTNLRKLKRHPRGPKKPVPKRTRFANKTHVSTARLLAKARKKAP